jgi:dienelactone hydrolase
VAVCVLVGVPVAQAAIPSSLKSSCTLKTPHPGFSYQFCDDGLPPTGGTTPNPGAVSAVPVPAKYSGYEGLPAKAGDAASVPGADGNGDVALDVDISIPTLPAPSGGYPVIAMMHGCCSGSKTSWEATSFDAGGELWHYSNAWFASRGYLVVNYTARGFVNGTNNGDKGSTGQTQLDSRRYEINDFQSLVGQIADDPFFDVDPQKVVVTGGSYGGGFSWMAFTDPKWTSPDGVDMQLAAAAPKYGWTDLVDSLVHSGRHSQDPNQLPAFDGSNSTSPIGFPKQSIVAALYASGKTGIPPGSAHTTFPPSVDDAMGCLQSSDPFETNPLCANALATTLPEFIDDRSAYYQNDFFAKVASDPTYRTPVFGAGTLTDPLFPPVEHLRMANRLQSIVPNYPIQQYFGDYNHFVQNKPKEWGDMCGSDHHVCNFSDYPGGDVNATPTDLFRTGVTTRLNRFVDHYAQPPGNPSAPQPNFDVTASLQICPQNAGGQAADEPGPTFTADSFPALTSGTLQVDMDGAQTTVNDASPNNHATNSDPVGNFAAAGGKCPVETQPAGPGVAVYDGEELNDEYTMIGATSVTISYSATTAQGLQLNSRLYDVLPNGTALMVDRGVRRVTSATGPVTYELHGNGWRFPPGHKIRIEIAQDDGPYIKPSNVPSSATITHVTLRMPVREETPYARPRGATPLRVPLVPAYKPCTGIPTSQHGQPLVFGSCTLPQLRSNRLTFGTPDANGKGAKSSGYVRYHAVPGDSSAPPNEADIQIAFELTDVRRKSDLSDYTGDVLLNQTLRLTDRHSGPGDNEPATVVASDFPIFPHCTATGDTTVGSTCQIATTANALVPGSVTEGRRSIWELGAIQVFDGGPDDDPASSPNDVFATEGVFVP